MRILQDLRGILREVARQADVLPAVGGAVEDLERPDFEEREDQALNEDERVFETVFENDSRSAGPRLYRPVARKGRTEEHVFRYFLDGSFRSYFLGTALEDNRETPIHFAQVGACVLRREQNGMVRQERLETRHILLAGKERLSEAMWQTLMRLAQSTSIHVVDLTEQDIVSRVLSDFDLRNKAAGKVRFEMHRVEAECVCEVLRKLDDRSWFIVDGSLLFQPLLQALLTQGSLLPIVGVSKSFRKDPQFVFGRGPRAERHSIYKLLANLQAEHRTAAFSSRDGRAVFWYVRLREQRHLDYPLMGVIKVELVNPAQEPVDSEVLDHLSSALVAERCVTPHGEDRRWHVHLYPIFLAERTVKESLFSREVIQQYVKWR